MFRKMRRAAREMPREEAQMILAAASSGVLAVCGDDGYPYTVPLNYAYCDDTLYFHSAREGHKIDAVRRSPKASFCVVARDDVVPERFTTDFASVVVFGTVQIVQDEAERRRAFELLVEKYAPREPQAAAEREIRTSAPAAAVLALKIAHISGKRSGQTAAQFPQNGKNC